MYRLSIKDLIEFYDTQGDEDTNKLHATALTSMIGEELSAGLIKHYFDNSGENNSAEVKGDVVTTGARKGKRLDKWILVKFNGKQILYQTEIKNWSSHSIGGQRLVMNASEGEVKKTAHLMFKNQFDEESKSLRWPTTAKVLTRMKPLLLDQSSQYEQRPLICFWFPILPESIRDPSICFSTVPVNNETFGELDIFSSSLYLRNLYNKGQDSTHIELDLPMLEKRLGILKKLFIEKEV